MNEIIFKASSTLFIKQKGDKLYLIYDIGAHVERLREDEITQQQADRVIKDDINGLTSDIVKVFREIQSKLTRDGIDPSKSNYSFEQYDIEVKLWRDSQNE